MEVFIKSLKKGDKFEFSNKVYTVKQKHSDWKKNGEPYLVTENSDIFYFDELKVELIK